MTVALGGLSTGPALRRSAVELTDADPLGGTAIPQSVLSALRRTRGSGQPLPGDLSASAGEALGRDLSPVRVHTDPEAATLARSVQAVAFTHGHDIYFSAGSYRPAEAEERLLAHELGHIGQSEPAGAVIGRADDPAEAAADRAATGVLAALRRQAVRSPVAAPGADHTGVGPRVLRKPTPAAGIHRMTVKQDGTYALFGGFRDTSDRAGFAAWVKELQDAGKTKVLQNLMTALHRSVLSLADHEAIGLSLVQRALDQLAPAAEGSCGR
ncbi:MAG: DUF4157 domain-containing protein [Jatrophihabitantaceae bacterium]